MGLLSRLFAKRSEPSLGEMDEAFTLCLRLLKVDLANDICNVYSAQMDHQDARGLAAQVTNFLMGEDVEEIARKSEEPLRSRIGAILPGLSLSAAKYMQGDRQTREIVVSTLRMVNMLNFGKYGTGWLENPAQKRIERLLVQYGPEFPEAVAPTAYLKMFGEYHAVKRKT